MKILLATLSIEPSSRCEHSSDCAYPLGLAYLYSVLEKDGDQVKLLFLNNFDSKYSEEQLFRCIKGWSPEVVAFQIFSMNRTTTFSAIEKIRSLYPGIRIIIGGIHTSVMYEQILKKFPDIVAVIGEGGING